MHAETCMDATAPARCLQRAEIERLIPHRGDFLFVKSLRILGPAHFMGEVVWSEDQAGIDGHFPGAPIVPAVFMVEAVAQVAGAGLMASAAQQSAGAEAPGAAGQIGVLAAIRRCAFNVPVFPRQDVQIEARAERAAAGFIAVKGQATAGGKSVANVELVLALAPYAQIFQTP